MRLAFAVLLLLVPARVAADSGAPGQTAGSQPAEPIAVQTADNGERPVIAAVADLSTYSGAVVGGQLRLASVGARVTGGWNLVMVSATDFDNPRSEYHLYSTGQVNAEVFAVPFSFGKFPIDAGLALGYRYNTVLGSGYGGSVDIQIYRWEHLGIHGFWGLGFYPDGEERLVENEGLDPGLDFNFPIGARFQMGLGVGLLFF